MAAQTTTNEATVALTASNARQFVEDQQRRAASFESRAVQLTGFTGVLIGLVAPIGVDALSDQTWTLPISLALGLSLLAAVTTAGILVIRVITPKPHLGLGAEEISEYLKDDRFKTQEPSEVHLRTLKGYKEECEEYEKVNGRKAVALRWGAISFFASLIFAVILVGTICLRPDVSVQEQFNWESKASPGQSEQRTLVGNTTEHPGRAERPEPGPPTRSPD